MDFDFSGMMERGGGAGLTLSMDKQMFLDKALD